VPSARRLSQTLGRAQSPIMKPPPPFVAPHALSRETRAAASASSSALWFTAAAKVGTGCPSFGGQRTAASARTREEAERLPKYLSPSIAATSLASVRSRRANRKRPGAFSRFEPSPSHQAPIRRLAYPALVCFAIQIQGKVTSQKARPNPSFKRTGLRPAA
jgi:hypothetical protein